MPFICAVLYYIIIVPACTISNFFGESENVWWIVIHVILYTIFIALPLWLIFNISVLTFVIIFGILELLCFVINFHNKIN